MEEATITSILDLIRPHLLGKKVKYIKSRENINTFISGMPFKNGTTNKQKMDPMQNRFRTKTPKLRYIGRHTVFNTGVVTEVEMDEGDVVLVIDDWDDTLYCGVDATLEPIGEDTYFINTQKYSA